MATVTEIPELNRLVYQHLSEDEYQRGYDWLSERSIAYEFYGDDRTKLILVQATPEERAEFERIIG